MKFLSLLSAVLVSLALVSAESNVATGAQEGKVPQMLSLINKLEHANPSDAAFAAQYASDLPKLAALHRDVAEQFGEKQVRKLYGDDHVADQLIALVKGAGEKRDVKKDHADEGKGKKLGHKKQAEPKKANHGDEVNKGKQGKKQSAAHAHKKQGAQKPTHKEHKKPAHQHKSKTAPKKTTITA